MGNVNSSGSMVLEFCAVHALAITNTVFRQANRLKTTWMHPRSQHWHLIDYVLTRQRDLRDVRLTRTVRGSEAWSDHRMVRCTVSLSAARPQRQHSRPTSRKLDVSKLREPDTRIKLQ